MNLNNISVAPFAQGIIKIDAQTDALTGEVRTLNRMLICGRTHAITETGDSSATPKLALHPMHEVLMDVVPVNKESKAIVEVPIKLFFNKTENALGIKYQAFSTDGVPVCSGNGKSAMRLSKAADATDTYEQHPCPGTEQCAFASLGDVQCRRQVKMTVQIDGQDDSLSVFEVRSSSLNSYRTLQAQLKMIEYRFGGLRHVPLKLQLWQASNQASRFAAFDLLRLSFNAPSEEAALEQTKVARLAVQYTGLLDEMDEIFSSNPDEQLIGLDDFTLISDFYDHAPVRRRVARPDAAATSEKQSKASTATGMSSAFISAAVLGAASHNLGSDAALDTLVAF